MDVIDLPQVYSYCKYSKSCLVELTGRHEHAHHAQRWTAMAPAPVPAPAPSMSCLFVGTTRSSTCPAATKCSLAGLQVRYRGVKSRTARSCLSTVQQNNRKWDGMGQNMHLRVVECATYCVSTHARASVRLPASPCSCSQSAGRFGGGLV